MKDNRPLSASEQDKILRFAELKPYFKYILECHNPSCKRLYGSDRQIKGLRLCPICTAKNKGNGSIIEGTGSYKKFNEGRKNAK